MKLLAAELVTAIRVPRMHGMINSLALYSGRRDQKDLHRFRAKPLRLDSMGRVRTNASERFRDDPVRFF